MIRIGETILDAESTKEIRQAISIRIEDLNKERKRLEDRFLFEGAAEVDEKVEELRNILRLLDPDGQIDGVAEASVRREDQTDAFQSVEGQAEAGKTEPAVEKVTVPLAALKAALILSGLRGRVGDEAFDKLDAEMPDDAPQRFAYVGRATIDLLEKLEAVDALELLTIAAEGIGVVEPITRSKEDADEDARRLDQLATMIAQDGAVRAPYYEPFPVAGEVTVQLEDATAAPDGFGEYTWANLTEAQLRAIIDAALLKPAPEDEAAQAKTAEQVKAQIEVLVHSPATGEEFKFAVEHASAEACEEALTIVSGLEGHTGREKALRKRLAVLAGEPGAEYDLTDPRKEALRILAAASGAVVSARVTDESAPSVNWAACNYLEAQGLAQESQEKGMWEITPKGLALAAKMDLLPEPSVPPAEGEGQPEQAEEVELEPATVGAENTSDLL